MKRLLNVLLHRTFLILTVREEEARIWFRAVLFQPRLIMPAQKQFLSLLRR